MLHNLVPNRIAQYSIVRPFTHITQNTGDIFTHVFSEFRRTLRSIQNSSMTLTLTSLQYIQKQLPTWNTLIRPVQVAVESLIPMSSRTLERLIVEWEQGATPGENRFKAGQIIRGFFQNFFEDSFQRFFHIERFYFTPLDLSNLGLCSLPKKVLKQLSVRHVILDGNRLPSLVGVELPRDLERLSVKDNQINSIIDINWPDSLRTLDLSGNPINHDDFSHPSLSHVELYLRRTPLIFFPERSSHFQWSPKPVGIHTAAEEVSYAKKNLIDFSGEYGKRKLYLLLEYVLKQIKKDLDWAKQHNICINQLLYQATTLNIEEKDELSILIERFAQQLRNDVYHQHPYFSKLISALESHFLYDHKDREEASLVFLADKVGILIRNEFYKQNICGDSVIESDSDIPWDSFACYYPDAEGNFHPGFSGNIKDLGDFFIPFPLLRKKYIELSHLSIEYKNFFKKCWKFNPVEVGLFAAAMKVVYFAEKLTDIDSQTRLLNLLKPLVDGLSESIRNPETIVLKDAHFLELIECFNLSHLSKKHMALWIFAKVAFSTRTSSEYVFGKSNISPIAFRYYALALLNKVIELYPQWLSAEQIDDFRKSLVGDSCTQILYNLMAKHVRMQSNNTILSTEDQNEIMIAWNKIIPAAWRYANTYYF